MGLASSRRYSPVRNEPNIRKRGEALYLCSSRTQRPASVLLELFNSTLCVFAPGSRTSGDRYVTCGVVQLIISRRSYERRRVARVRELCVARLVSTTRFVSRWLCCMCWIARLSVDTNLRGCVNFCFLILSPYSHTCWRRTSIVQDPVRIGPGCYTVFLSKPFKPRRSVLNIA